jgi:hypothetical protein
MNHSDEHDELRSLTELLANAEVRRRLKEQLEEGRKFRERPEVQAFLNAPPGPAIERVLRARDEAGPALVLGDTAKPGLLDRLGEALGRSFERSRGVVEHLVAHVNRLGEPIGAVARSVRSNGGAAVTSPTLEPFPVQVHGPEGERRVNVEVWLPVRLAPLEGEVKGVLLTAHYRTVESLPAGEWWWVVNFQRLDRPGDPRQTLVCVGEQAAGGGVVEWKPEEKVALESSMDAAELDAGDMEYELVGLAVGGGR